MLVMLRLSLLEQSRICFNTYASVTTTNAIMKGQANESSLKSIDVVAVDNFLNRLSNDLNFVVCHGIIVAVSNSSWRRTDCRSRRYGGRC